MSQSTFGPAAARADIEDGPAQLIRAKVPLRISFAGRRHLVLYCESDKQHAIR